MSLSALIQFYETLTPESVHRCAEFYAARAAFKDPFNDVRGVAAIERILAHMFKQLDAPRFVVTSSLSGANEAMLMWELHFRSSSWGRSKDELVRGMTYLVFAGDGKVAFHRDHWDAAGELYEKLPGLGLLMRWLRRRLAA